MCFKDKDGRCLEQLTCKSGQTKLNAYTCVHLGAEAVVKERSVSKILYKPSNDLQPNEVTATSTKKQVEIRALDAFNLHWSVAAEEGLFPNQIVNASALAGSVCRQQDDTTVHGFDLFFNPAGLRGLKEGSTNRTRLVFTASALNDTCAIWHSARLPVTLQSLDVAIHVRALPSITKSTLHVINIL